ncbi:MAG: transcriptional regulator [Sphingomonadales bacterium]|nr:transcriptional regulator [Sphingomonadales bacterium]
MTSSPFAYPGLDRVFHERARLGIMTSLAGRADGLSFTELKQLCGVTDGNLNRHLQVLEEAGHVALSRQVARTGGSRRPQTRVLLTEAGRAAFATYLDELAQVLAEARAAATRPMKGLPA